MVHGGGVTKPLFIIDHRDRYTIQMYHKTITNLITEARKAVGNTRTAKWKQYYSFKRSILWLPI